MNTTTPNRRIFRLVNANPTGTFSHTITFEPAGDNVIIRKYLWDSIMGNWSQDIGQAIITPVADARRQYAEYRSYGYKVSHLIPAASVA